MTRFSTREAAKKLGISHNALAVYARTGKVPAPESIKHGEKIAHIWTEAEIEHVRQLLPKIANGRKTRYQKLREKQKAQPKSTAPHKKRSKKPKPPSG
jgi:predicted site-specific integrase-resolvase